MKWLVLLALLFEAGLACGDDKQKTLPVNPSPPAEQKWQDECGSCHIAYPPRFLAAQDWQRLMGSLGKHFGDNAELDAKSNQEILAYLTSHARSGARYSAPSLRISDTPWFARAHHEVAARAWADPTVKSRANCTACHVDAERGDWSEEGVRMPAGLGGEEEEENEY